MITDTRLCNSAGAAHDPMDLIAATGAGAGFEARAAADASGNDGVFV
jgi:hypothetical protein